MAQAAARATRVQAPPRPTSRLATLGPLRAISRPPAALPPVTAQPAAAAAAADDRSSVREWLATWQTFIRARDFDHARQLFAPGVLGFGSVATVARSLDDLEGAQWRRVWPKLGSFAFEDEHQSVIVSEDRLLATVATTWSSTWTADGADRPRPGRASIVLVRAAADGPWRAVHTHFSLNPA